MAFARLKRLLRSDGHRDVPTLTAFLDTVTEVFRPAECMNDIRHRGYSEYPTTTPPNWH